MGGEGFKGGDYMWTLDGTANRTLPPAFPARGYLVGDWGPHSSRQAVSGEAPTAERTPMATSGGSTIDRRSIDLQPVDPLATPFQCVLAENASHPRSGGTRVLLLATCLTGVGPGLGRSSFMGVISARVGPGPFPRRLNPGAPFGFCGPAGTICAKA